MREKGHEVSFLIFLVLHYSYYFASAYSLGHERERTWKLEVSFLFFFWVLLCITPILQVPVIALSSMINEHMTFGLRNIIVTILHKCAQYTMTTSGIFEKGVQK